MVTKTPKRQFPGPKEAVMRWLLDSDPAIRWQVMRDLMDESEEVVIWRLFNVQACDP
jgi:hypothetical protein